MKPLTLVCFLLFLIGIAMGVIQMWFQTWRPELFAKMIITDIALFVITFILAFLIRENKESERVNRGKNSLD